MGDADHNDELDLRELCATLHDGVLQLLEFMAVGGHGQLRHPGEYRALAGLAAADLRGVVEGGAALDGRLDAELRRIAEHARVLDPEVDVRIDVAVGCAQLAAAEVRPLVMAAREALNNALQHAGARRVLLRCTCTNDHIELRVRDDGSGSPHGARAGFGMRESIVARVTRAGGSVTISAAPGGGTSVDMELDGGRRS